MWPPRQATVAVPHVLPDGIWGTEPQRREDSPEAAPLRGVRQGPGTAASASGAADPGARAPVLFLSGPRWVGRAQVPARLGPSALPGPGRPHSSRSCPLSPWEGARQAAAEARGAATTPAVSGDSKGGRRPPASVPRGPPLSSHLRGVCPRHGGSHSGGWHSQRSQFLAPGASFPPASPAGGRGRPSPPATQL